MHIFKLGGWEHVRSFMLYYFNILAKIYNKLNHKFIKCTSSSTQKCLGCLQKEQDVSKKRRLYTAQPDFPLPAPNVSSRTQPLCFTYQVSPESFFEEKIPRIFLEVSEHNWSKPTHYIFIQLYFGKENGQSWLRVF